MILYISHGPLLAWLCPRFGIWGASWFLWVAEWVFGALLCAGFWNKTCGILGALGSCAAFIGTVTNVSSVTSEHPVPHSSLYAATKGVIDTLTLALAKELGPRNIRVNAVAPGHTETEGTRCIGLVGSEQARQRVAATPLGGRFGQPEDIAPVVVFLASDGTAWLTDECISSSGGAR